MSRRGAKGGEPLSMAPARSLQKMNSKMAELSKDIAEFTEDKQATIKRNEARAKREKLKQTEQATQQMTQNELLNKYKDLLHKHDKLQESHDKLKADADMRKESYQRSHSKLQGEVDGLKSHISKQDEQRARGLDGVIHEIRTKHEKIQEKIYVMKDQTSQILQEQEHDLLRPFRARMYDVTMQLEKERNQKDDGALEWIDKARALGKELDVYKMEAVRLDRENQRLQKENNRLRMQFKSQEEDRDELVRQVLALKRETAKLRSDLDRRQGESRPGTSQGAAPSPGGAHGRLAPLLPPSSSPALGKAEVEQRYQDIIKRLKRLLEIERRNLRTVRTAHVTELANRTELEAFLRQCIEDVKKEISRRRAEMMANMNRSKHGGGASTVEEISLGDFSAADRERVMELLLSQERVINLLYDKTFPRKAGDGKGTMEALPPLEDDDLEGLGEGLDDLPLDGDMGEEDVGDM